MVKKILGLTKHRMVVLVSVFLFVAITASGYYYYLKTHQTSADVLRTTSCVIKVVDKETGKAIKNVQALFMIMPIGSTSVSDANGCVALPSALANSKTGDYYQVSLNRQKYANNLFHLSISNEVLSGKRQNKVELYPVSTVSAGTSLPALPTTNQNSISNNLINKAHAESLQTVYGSVDIYDALSTISNSENYSKASPLADAKIDFFDQNKKKVGECRSDANGTCKMQVKIANGMTSVKGTVYKTNYKTDFVQFNLATDKDTVGWLVREIYLWPDYTTKPIKTFTGNSKLDKCQASYSFPATFVALKTDIDKPLWDEVSIQEAANNLASVICALKQSKDGLKYIPTPKLYIVNAEPKQAAGWVSVGSSYISVQNKELCGGMTLEERYVCHTYGDRVAWRFHMVVHEYGHVLDSAGLGGYGRISDEDYNPNFRNLFALVNAVNEKDEYQGKAAFGDCKIVNGKSKYQGKDGYYNCYYTTNRAEFWAESFARYLGLSFDADLKLNTNNQKYIEQGTIVIMTDKLDNSVDTLNAYKFWKKFMATTLGSYCHPSIVDDNDMKQGMLFAPDTGIPAVLKGGPISYLYSVQDILNGVPLKGSGISINFKQVAKDYKSGMTDEGFSVIPYPLAENAIDLAKYFSNGVWPDTLTSDNKRCGLYPRSYLRISNAELLKQQDFTTGSLPLASMSSYSLKGFYRCKKTEPFKVVNIQDDIKLDTETKNQKFDIDITKFISCPSTSTATPEMPPGMK